MKGGKGGGACGAKEEKGGQGEGWGYCLRFRRKSEFRQISGSEI